MRIDLNCDMGEIPEDISNGVQEALMAHIMSVNIACGGHAGDEFTMETTLRQAARHGLTVGAHPGYPDKANFGRRELNLNPAQIVETVYSQLDTFGQIAQRLAVPVVHVKPHGALYNQAVNNPEIAQAIAEGVAQWNTRVVLVGLAKSQMLDIFRQAGFTTAAEAFADRRYEPDGTLRNRKFPDALIRDPQAAADQALSIAQNQTAQTICIHGDTPGAVEIARAVAARLAAAGIKLRGLTQ